MSQKKKTIVLLILPVVCILSHDFAVPAGNTEFNLQPNRGEKLLLKPYVTWDMELEHNEAESSWRYAIIQVHVQQNNVTLSLNPDFTYDETDTGKDVAILYPIKNLYGSYHFYLKSESKVDTFNVDIISVPYIYGAPFPGGCCLTCNMEFDPNLVISYDSVETNVTFAFANVYYKRSENSSSVPCDGNKHPGKSPEHYRLEYHIYLMFLEEGDTSEETFFKGLEKMAYPAVIKTNGRKTASLKAPNIPVVKFDTHQVGQGVVYNVIVYDPVTQREAAYSPAVTYAPNYFRLGVVDAVFAVAGSLIGLIFCLFGFRLFKFTCLGFGVNGVKEMAETVICLLQIKLFKYTALFFGGLANFSIIFFIIIDANTNLSHLGTMLTSAGLGVVFGGLVFALWWFTEWTRICLLFNSLLLGFLVGATLLFTPLGELDVVQGSDFDYGAIICACTVVVPVILVLWPFLLCVVYTSIVSAYAFIVGIDFFIHTSISFIVIDVILHATKPQYRRDHLLVTRPFQQNDYILSATWVFLSFLGCFVQYVMCRNRQFPKSGFTEQRRVRKYLISKHRIEETTPLLINSDTQRTDGGNTIC